MLRKAAGRAGRSGTNLGGELDVEPVARRRRRAYFGLDHRRCFGRRQWQRRSWARPRRRQAQWKPTKPVTIIVPWAAGGATDQVTRLAAAELEAGLGQKIVVVNQPGGAGSIGTKAAMDAPRDGYTWTAGAAKQLGTYPVLGMINSKLDDFHLFLAVTNVSIVSVNPQTPYQTFPQLLDGDEAKQLPVATAGNSSSGHFAMEAIAKATGVKYRHVTYDGGNPAVVSTVAGETEVTTQLAPEQAEMIKGKRLRPLAVVGDQPLTIEGCGTIPPITHFVKDFPKVDDRLRHLHPEGRAARGGGHGREALGRADRQVGEAEEVRQPTRGAVHAAVRQGGVRRGLADGGHRRLPAAGRGHGEGVAGIAGYQALTQARTRGRRTAPDRDESLSGAASLAGVCGAAIAGRLVAHGPARGAAASTRGRRRACCPASSALLMILLALALACAALRAIAAARGPEPMATAPPCRRRRRAGCARACCASLFAGGRRSATALPFAVEGAAFIFVFTVRCSAGREMARRSGASAAACCVIDAGRWRSPRRRLISWLVRVACSWCACR